MSVVCGVLLAVAGRGQRPELKDRPRGAGYHTFNLRIRNFN